MDKLVATLDELWEHFKADPERLYLTTASRRELSEDIIGDPKGNICHMGGGAPLGSVGVTVHTVLNNNTGSAIDVETIDPDLPGRLDYLETRIQIV
jgi:hypothetical protein